MAYHDRDDIEDIYGPDNVEIWADLDNDESAVKIAARVARGIVITDMMFDEYLEATEYRTPIRTKADTVPATITDLAAKNTGAWLSLCRGNALTDVIKEVRAELAAYKSGDRKIHGAV